MKRNKLLAMAVAAAFALPFAAQVSAAGDSIILAQGAGAPPSGASSVGTGPTGGTASPQSAGEPKAPTADRSRSSGASSSGAMSSGSSSSGATASKSRLPEFSAIDKNGDGQISRAEWEAYQRSAGAASGGATSSSGTGKTGTTADPGESSPRTAPGSATATKPDTSGTGKAQ